MMETARKVIGAFAEGTEEYEKRRDERCVFHPFEIYGKGGECRIGLGDNMDYLAYLRNVLSMEKKVQLIYIDPPFFSKGSYLATVRLESDILGRSPLIKTNAYEDKWDGDPAKYIRMMTPRLLMMRDLLKDEGFIAVHVDWHAVHYVRMVMDEIFGAGNLVNEIIWTYKSGGSTRRSFSKKHDTILLYSRTKDYAFNPLREKSYNRDMKPYRFRGVEEFRDEKGWYTMVNMKDVWAIDMVGRTSSERTGYATQKPRKLLERIIEACSREGDVCADLFAGSGSFGRACEDLGRKWIMCDMNGRAAADQIGSLTSSSFTAERRDGGQASCDVKLSFDGKKMSLTEYIMDDRSIFCDNIDEVKKYLEKDSVSLVAGWSIDTDRGDVHRPRLTAGRGERSLPCAAEAGRRITVAGYDVFGNRFEKDFLPGESEGE